MDKFIVAEVNKNWFRGFPVTENGKLISNQFEEVINVNYSRGYKLKEWKYFTIINGDNLVETIIAIFEAIEIQEALQQ